jgi:hypothetical protein
MEQSKSEPIIYTKTCYYCGKTMESLYKKQLEYNFKLHKESCRLKHELKQNKSTKKGGKE